jgi:NitT/TauT family transport system substrate-binding protein
MRRTISWALDLTLLLLVCSACGRQPTQTVHITLPLGYIPNVQFAPVYVALERGYFAQEGIAIDFNYSQETDITALVGADQYQFGVVSGEQVLLARAQGLPVVYVAAWYQQYPVSVVAMADQDIRKPADLRGKTIGLPGLYGANYIGLQALLHAGGLSLKDVTLDSIGYTQVESLATGRDQVVSVYTGNEPVQLRARGYSIDELRLEDYVQLASNGIITNEKTIADDPALVRGMVQAFLHGLSDTLADPQAAYQISRKYVPDLAQNDPIQMQVLTTTLGLWKANRLGISNPQAWENMQSVLLELGLLTKPLDLTKAFTNQFVP